jgi:peptidoglycan/xylan/chitin deacetylase (PgdA/CDA1 family)
MLRSIAKSCFAAAYTATHARRSVESPFIICYHRVVEDFERSAGGTIPAMLISKGMFERHLDWVAKRFSILSLDEIGLHLAAGRAFRRPPAAITFDDGYADVYRHAFPLLQKKGIPAAVFVVTGFIGTGRPQMFDRLHMALQSLRSKGAPLGSSVLAVLRSLDISTDGLARISADHDCFQLMTTLLNSLPQEQIIWLLAALEQESVLDRAVLEDLSPVDWDMVRTMHRNGVTIGSHTDSHVLLTSESMETARLELLRSKQALESQLKTEINHFAYPDGRFNGALVQAVNSAGYRFAYGICGRQDKALPLLTIPRKVLWERACVNALGRFSSSIMNCQAIGAFDAKDRCEHDHSVIEAEGANGSIN